MRGNFHFSLDLRLSLVFRLLAMLARLSTTWRRSLQPISLSVRVASKPTESFVPLVSDWPALLDSARAMGDVIIQTRHRHARLITQTHMPEFCWDATYRNARSADGKFHLHVSQWTRAFGWTHQCACCGSPGGISIHDHSPAEFLQICVPAGSSTGPHWEHFVEEWRAIAPHAAIDSSIRCDVMGRLQQVPPPLTALPMDGGLHTLSTILQSVISQNLRIRCALETPGSRQCCEFRPDKLDLENRLLRLSGEGNVAQVILPAIAGLSLEQTASTRRLHLIGLNGGSLLGITPSRSTSDINAWKGILREAFKSAC